MAQTVLPKQTG